ncbi:hypothetical protein WISP_100038 [Willisornis vidua]|uniref:Peptidase A2 domain-containing protein n=1 Tax=Willisornis vidua TaxID=1566151 RepID=A0ABQ9D3E3_9PASS|nr:hypothetical protein WISP_100038 [Willisornis vidua]
MAVCSEEVPLLKGTGSLTSEVHYITAHSARQDAVPEATPLPSFTTVKQEKTEPYQHFVDKLHQAITSHAGLENHEKKFMFHLLALENASQRTISEMLEIAGRVNQRSQTQTVAEAFTAMADLESFCSGNIVRAGEPNRVCLIGVPYYNIKDFIPFGIEEEDDEDSAACPSSHNSYALAPSSDGKPRVTRWSGFIRDAILEGYWTAVDTVVCPVVLDNGGPRYCQHDWKVMQQARKALKEGGINTESGCLVLDWIFTAETNSPHDCKNIARFFLTPSQQLAWHKEWKRLAQLEAARPSGAGDPLAGVTSDMLTGDGQFEDVQVQLRFPAVLHHTTARLARQAFYGVSDRAPLPLLTSVKQGITEPYSHFIDRLSQSIMAQNDLTVDGKGYLLKLLAFENANAQTRPLLATLPKDAEVPEMLEVASRANRQQQSQAMAGPIYHENSKMGALLIGRSSAGTAGLIVLPGVIDADYTGEILIACYTLTPPLLIQKGTRIAQLVLLPKSEVGDQKTSRLARGGNGFGSSGDVVVSLMQKMKARPMVTVQLTCNEKSVAISMMMDTGADVTIVSRQLWPRSWRLQPAVDAVQGVGGGSNPLQSVQPFQLRFPEGQTVSTCPYVMALPGQLDGLIGRDVLSQLGVTVSVPEPGKHFYARSLLKSCQPPVFVGDQMIMFGSSSGRCLRSGWTLPIRL